MQVNSTSSFTPQATASISVDNKVRVNESNDRLTVRPDQKKPSQQEQQKKQNTRFDVDEQALAVLEKEQANFSVTTSMPNNANTSYDQPSSANLTAVSAYHSVDNIAKRESIEQAFGVDLYT